MRRFFEKILSTAGIRPNLDTPEEEWLYRWSKARGAGSRLGWTEVLE